MIIINGKIPDIEYRLGIVETELAAGSDLGYLELSAASDTVLATANQYYPVSGTFTTDGTNSDFTIDASGTITYSGLDPIRIIMIGTSDVRVDKACLLTYGLFNKGVLIPGAFTPHDFVAASKTSTLSITSSFVVSAGDVFQVYAKSDTSNTTATSNNLNVVILQA